MNNQNLPESRPQHIPRKRRGAAPPKHVSSAAAPAVDPILNRLAIELEWFDALLPGNRLPLKARAAAVMQVMPPFDYLIQADAQRFGSITRLKPGGRAYIRAEFRNVLYAMARRAREWNDGHKGPYYFALYSMLSACGFGPHSDAGLIAAWREGLGGAALEGRERRYKSWFNHLRNRIALARRALDMGADLSARRRASILNADPLIAEGERERAPGHKRASRAAEAT